MLFLASLAGMIYSCSGPQNTDTSPSTNWYKGNLHTHSLWSDGDDYPEMILQWYKDHDYHFLGLSDHNILQEGDKWVPVANNPIRQKAYRDYLQKWGTDWVEQREDSAGTSVKLKTLEEYRGKFESPGNFLILKCEEISDRFWTKPIHLNATNLQTVIPPAGGASPVKVLQNNIDAVMAQRAATGQPMIVHINHPNFHWAFSAEEMMQLRNERFFEVYNGHPAVRNYGDSTHLGTEEMWDSINLHYAQNDLPLMYGLAVDDSHNYHNLGLEYSNAGRGWVVVQAKELTPEALIESLEGGKFYASTGVELANYECKDAEIKLSIKTEEGVKYRIQYIGARKGSAQVSTLQEVTGNSAAYVMTGDELFVRAKISSDKLQGNPFRTGDYEVAWTQPVQPDR